MKTIQFLEEINSELDSIKFSDYSYAQIINILSSCNNYDELSTKEYETEEEIKLLCNIKLKIFLMILVYKYYYTLIFAYNDYFSRGYIYKFCMEFYKKYMKDCFPEFDMCLDPSICENFNYNSLIKSQGGETCYLLIKRWFDMQYDFDILLKLKTCIKKDDTRYYQLHMNKKLTRIYSEPKDSIPSKIQNFFEIKKVSKEKYEKFKILDSKPSTSMVIL